MVNGVEGESEREIAHDRREEIEPAKELLKHSHLRKDGKAKWARAKAKIKVSALCKGYFHSLMVFGVALQSVFFIILGPLSLIK